MNKYVILHIPTGNFVSVRAFKDNEIELTKENKNSIYYAFYLSQEYINKLYPNKNDKTGIAALFYSRNKQLLSNYLKTKDIRKHIAIDIYGRNTKEVIENEEFEILNIGETK